MSPDFFPAHTKQKREKAVWQRETSCKVQWVEHSENELHEANEPTDRQIY